ncbi:MAG TPA: peptidase M10 [Chitinophagaceae bacterium]
MGTAEFDSNASGIIIRSNIIVYGDAASVEIAGRMREEIENMWNAPACRVQLAGKTYAVTFAISAECIPSISPETVNRNLDPRNNFFRVEEHAHGNISFVDGIGSNSGYFQLDNLYPGSTTAAHEYGHTIGLDHPRILDVRGKGVPGIMYPRGTLVDAQFQYDPSKPAGVTGGTMHPMHRKVTCEDIAMLGLGRLLRRAKTAIIGEFTNVYHWRHEQAPS